MTKVLSAADIARYQQGEVCFPVPALTAAKALHYPPAWRHSSAAKAARCAEA